MYSAGDEFEFEIDDTLEYFTCLGEYSYLDVEYLICENEDGVKKVFYYDLNDEELILIEDEDEEEVILDHYQEDIYKSDEKFDYWEESEYSDYKGFSEPEDIIETDDIVDEEDLDYISGYDDDEDIEEFLDDLFDDED